MKKSKALGLILRKPLLLVKKGLKETNENDHAQRIRSTYGISQLPTIDLMELFPEGFDGTISNYTFLNGTSLITDLLLLKSLAQSIDDCVYLEIGSWRGESLSNVADVAKECVSVSLSAAEMREMGLSEGFVEVHGIFSSNYPNVTKVEANSHTFDFNSLNKKFDLIFVDGDHSYEGVLNDTKKVFGLRKDQSSIIVWHDYGYNAEDVRPSVLNGILDGIPKEFHGNLYHVSNTMCAVYIEDRKFNTTQTQFPTYPNKTFVVQIRTKPFVDNQ